MDGDPSSGEGAPASDATGAEASRQADGVDALYASSGAGGGSADDATTVSWLDVRAHEPVLSSDGQEVGKVVEVAALPEEDIFHGIVLQHHARGVHVLAPASDIARITERAVHLSVDASAAAAYAPFQEMHVKNLGLRGIFHWKHLGWKDAPE